MKIYTQDDYPRKRTDIKGNDMFLSVNVFVSTKDLYDGIAFYRYDSKNWVVFGLPDCNDLKFQWVYPEQVFKGSPLIDLLIECRVQLCYLNNKFTATGTTNSLLSRIDHALDLAIKKSGKKKTDLNNRL